MKKCFKILFISSALLLTTACQDKLDTSSAQAKEQSIKQMMVGIYPQNQKIFKQALSIIYEAERKKHSQLKKEDVIALTDKKLNGKTVEDILRLSFLSKKLKNRKIRKLRKTNKLDEPISTIVVVNNETKLDPLIKTSFEAKQK